MNKKWTEERKKTYMKEYYLKNKELLKVKYREYKVKYRKENLEKLRKNNRKYEKENYNKISKSKKEYYIKNKVEIRKRQKKYENSDNGKIKRKKYLESEKGRKKTRKANRNYLNKNPHMTKYNNSVRRARLKNQTPSNEDLKAIKEFYKNCPEGMEVDHIFPLSKKGLHTIKNLQYLTREENRRKGAKILC